LDWICGDRVVAGDTSTGADIYHWRFGPRSTTRRNEDYYLWAWSNAESIPWGGQVQDGGAVLGWSYYDLMARLKVRGPDSVAPRLAEIASWFDEVTAAGGYRQYYDGSREGTLQGGGTAGGLGLDQEFFESVLTPQIFVAGLLGFKARPDGFELDPRLPNGWPELTVTRMRFRDLVFDIRAAHTSVDLTVVESAGCPGIDYVVVAGDSWHPAEQTLAPNAPVGKSLRFTRK
jgi:hypothetical protein